MNPKAVVLPVGPSKQRALEERMRALGIHEDDLDESFVRSSGKGGQNVNRVATCVMLHHRPSGMRVKCQIARTQGLNRYYARKLLADKVEELQRGVESERRQRIEKIRRQKRRRSKRAKEKMLEEKRRKSEKKLFRRKPLLDNAS